jgi:hypothetical protein
MIRGFAAFPRDALWGTTKQDVLQSITYARLLQMNLIKTAAHVIDGGVVYRWTDIGWAVAQAVERMPQVRQLDDDLSRWSVFPPQ